MVYGTEKPLTRRGRIIVTVIAWLVVGVPVFVGLWFWSGWWFLVPLPFAVWATWDYLEKGDMISQIDHAISHHVRTDEDGKSRFGHDG